MIEQILKLTRDYFGGSLYLGDALDFATRVVELKPAPSTDSAISALDSAVIGYLIASDKKISAIKYYRTATGVSLKPAKDAVDALHAQIEEDAIVQEANNRTYPF